MGTDTFSRAYHKGIVALRPLLEGGNELSTVPEPLPYECAMRRLSPLFTGVQFLIS